MKDLLVKTLNYGAFTGILCGTAGILLNLISSGSGKMLTSSGIFILIITPPVGLLLLGLGYLRERNHILFLFSIGTLLLLLTGIFFSR